MRASGAQDPMTARPKSQHIPASLRPPGYVQVVSPATGPVLFLEFGLITLHRGDGPLSVESGGREAVLYQIGGTCDVAVSGQAGDLSGTLDARGSVFEGPPSAVFAPPGSRITITAQGDTRLALFTSPPSADRPPRIVDPAQVAIRTVGTGNWTRRVSSVVDERIASRLLVGETINPPGNWSSYPPHKHDTTVPDGELAMEEVYHFFVTPPGGFGLQMVYTAPGDPHPFQEIYRVTEGDTVVIPRGYHPVVAAGGYQLAYLWAISGERVGYAAWSEDPAYAWLRR